MIPGILVVLYLMIALSDGRAAISERETHEKTCTYGWAGLSLTEGETVIMYHECKECVCVVMGDEAKLECNTIEKCEGCNRLGHYYEPGDQFDLNECTNCTCIGGSADAISCEIDPHCRQRNVGKRHAMGYYMAMAYAKLQEQKKKDRMAAGSRTSRDTENEEFLRQKKYMAMAHARQNERNRKFKNRKKKNAGYTVDAGIQKKNIGYLMGIAHLKLEDNYRKSNNRKNRNIEDAGDIKIQRKYIGYLMGTAHARQEQRNRKYKNRQSRNADETAENIDIAKKYIGYFMGMAHARQEERNRKSKNRKVRNADKAPGNITKKYENTNKRQNEVYGCDLGDIWFNVGETWGDGCSEPFCECMSSGEVECEMNGPGCGDGCNYQGKYISVGDRIPDPSGCGSCTCHEDGLIYCTQMLDCNSCFMGDIKYAVGEVAPSSDGCNYCTCAYGGQWGCTEKACQ